MHALQPGICITHISAEMIRIPGVWAQFTVFWGAGDRSPAS